MKAYDYLLQIRKLDLNIENKLIELERLKAMKGISYSDDKVQTSVKDTFADLMIKIVETNEEINRMIDEIVDKKKEVIGVLEQITDPDAYNILHMYFIQNISWNQIHRKKYKNYSYPWVIWKKNEGLRQVQEIIERL